MTFSLQPLRRAVAYVRTNPWVVLIALVIIADLVLAYYYFLAPAPNATPVNETPPVVEAPTPPPGTVPSALNGEYVPEATAKIRPLAVMIDHHADARPPAGISKASIVWETFAEGGVTRLMPIFQTVEDVAIGPVRSARDYFLPWSQEVDAIYVHSGGSTAGLAALAATPSIPNADEFRNGSAFYRAPGVASPHNLFTSIKRLLDLADRRQWQKEVAVSPWGVSDVVPAGVQGTKVRVDFSSLSYRVEWSYDAETKTYRRTLGGTIAIDRNTRQQLTTKNVVILFADIQSIPDPTVPGAPLIAVAIPKTGSGEAWFFRDGILVKGRWEKSAVDGRTVLQHTDGTPYLIARGQVWVEVVPQSKNIVTLP